MGYPSFLHIILELQKIEITLHDVHRRIYKIELGWMSIDGTVTAGSCRTEEEKTLRIIAGAPWYVSNLQLHEDLEIPYLAEHIRNVSCIEIKG